jgi:histone H3/H4
MVVMKSKVKELFKKGGVSRVSNEAVEEVAKAVEKYVEEIVKKAVANAKHAKRETVKGEDVKLALK